MYRTPATGRDGSTSKHQIKTAPSPIGGLNTRDSLANMPPGDCPVLINWIPDIGGMRSRGGFFEWAINFPGSLPIQSILAYFSATDTFPGGAFVDTPSVLPGQVFAATDDGIYEITTVTDAPVLSEALSGDPLAGWLSYTMLTNSGGTFMLVCSEADGYKHYNGTTWTTPAFGVGAGEVSGCDPAKFCFVVVWKKRAWFVEKDSTRAWFLTSEAINGVAAVQDFGPLFKKGGHLSYLANWTMDAGEGIDDFLVAVSSNGDVVIYKGTDPTSADTFGLVGQWYVGQIPVGRRAFTQLGGDLVLLSTEGIFPVSQITRGGTQLLAASGDYSSKIRPTVGNYTRKTFTSRGWQMLVHSTERLLVVSTPDSEEVVDNQFAMSTTLNAWTVLAGVPAYCLGATAGYMLSGTSDSRVLLILNGPADNVPYGSSVGDPIYCTIQYAFNYFEAPAIQKQFLLARPSFLAAIEPAANLDVAVNFTFTTPQRALVGSVTPGTTVWDGDELDPYDQFDFGYWDGVPGERALYWADWRSVTGLGYSGAATMSSAHAVRTTLTAMDYVYQMGGPL